MSTATIYSKFELLPDNLQQEAADFIEFLFEKSKPTKEKIGPVPGSAKGKIWMADDFDGPLDEFKEYM